MAGADLVEAISLLEDVKNACAAGQARLGVTLRRVRECQAEAGDLGERGRRDAHRSAVGEVALARRESPHRAQRLLGLAGVLTQEMPHTWAAFQQGRISEWRAMLMARETACLSLEDRQWVDEEMAEDLVISDEALLGGGPTPADLVGYGPIPAGVARNLVVRAAQGEAGVSIRRLYVTPVGRLVAMESTARSAPAGLARFIRARDSHTCRTPYCSAPIRHIDHVRPHHAGGPTRADNLQGLCQWCNQTKEAPGWRAITHADGALTLMTPTGTHHTTIPPPLPHEERLDLGWRRTRTG